MSMQRTDEWHQARLGKATASRIADLTARTKDGKWGESRENYLWELVTERRTGKPFEGYVSFAMQQGTAREAEGLAQYAIRTLDKVYPVGFCPHQKIAMSGGSPDRLVGENGLVEIKCPELKAHYRMLLGGEISSRYVKQMMWQLACTGRRWCDWVSYNPDVLAGEQMVVERVLRDDAMIAELEREVVVFLIEVDEAMKRLDARLEREAA